MKIILVAHDRVKLFTRRLSAAESHAVLHDPSSTPDGNYREIILQSRELNGITRMVAYDQEADTLFIQEPANATPT